MKKYLMGIDNGGSDIKCAIFDTLGNEIAAASTQVPINVPQEGFTERDVNDVWIGNIEVIKNSIKKSWYQF